MTKAEYDEGTWREWYGPYPAFVSPHVDLVMFCDGACDDDDSRDKSLEQLARALQRDGVATTLSDARHLAAQSTVVSGYYGHTEGDSVETACDSHGETEDGDLLTTVLACTFAAIS